MRDQGKLLPMKFKAKNKHQTGSSQKTKPTKRAPKKITADYLHNAGLYYLQRYASSASNFRSVMMRKIRKSCRHHSDQDFEPCVEMLDALVEKFIRAGLINDDVYVEGVIRSERRRGRSQKAIIAKLASKGLASDFVKQKLEDAAQDKDAELEAAMIFARRKKFGPYAIKELEPQKVLAAFARAGFSYDISKQVLRIEPRELEELEGL